MSWLGLPFLVLCSRPPGFLFLGPCRVVGETLKWVEAGVSRDGARGSWHGHASKRFGMEHVLEHLVPYPVPYLWNNMFVRCSIPIVPYLWIQLFKVQSKCDWDDTSDFLVQFCLYHHSIPVPYLMEQGIRSIPYGTGRCTMFTWDPEFWCTPKLLALYCTPLGSIVFPLPSRTCSPDWSRLQQAKPLDQGRRPNQGSYVRSYRSTYLSIYLSHPVLSHSSSGIIHHGGLINNGGGGAFFKTKNGSANWN